MKTFAMIKPSCVKYAGEVRRLIEAAGLMIEDEAVVQLTEDQAEEFYSEHKDKSFFKGLVKMMTSAPVVVLCLSSENAVQVWRNLIGPTNPNDVKANPNQLRRCFANGEAYAAGNPDNGFHGSAPGDEDRELGLMRKWGYLK